LSLKRYDTEVSQGVLSADAEQRDVMRMLDHIGNALKKRNHWKPPSRSVFARWTNRFDTKVDCVQGLYLWGGVGRGKTYLCDLFFEELQIKDKTRLHFHRFMRQIHKDLRNLDGVENPLDIIADDWAQRARLLLLDEIHVNDITDAMLRDAWHHRLPPKVVANRAYLHGGYIYKRTGG